MGTTGSGAEYFSWCGHIFEVEKIRKAVAAGKLKGERVLRGPFAIAPWAKHLGLDQIEQDQDGKWIGQGFPIIGCRIDLEKAQQIPETELDKPDVCLFIGWDDPQTGEPRSLMIDGHHRLARAVMLKREKLPALMVRFETPKALGPYYRPLSGKLHIMRLRDTSKPRKPRNQVKR